MLHAGNLSEKIELPSIRLQKPRCEADYYGVSDLIATKLGISLPPPISNASWLHGWRFQRVKYVGELILRFNRHLSRHLVAKQDHADFLLNAGVKNVEVVGMPFCYFLEEEQLNDNSHKIANSLLVMPPHTTKSIDSAPEEEAYIEHILDSSGAGKFICFCIHQDCEARGYWVSSLKKFGIPFVTGSSIADRNGLLRMVSIYRNFESMTTNVFGSHILQASLMGLKVSVNGPFWSPDITAIIKASHWLYKQDDLLAYKNLAEGSQFSVLQQQFPHFFCSIADAESHQKWAIEESGYKFKKDWAEIAEFLGWRNRNLNLLDYHTIRYVRLFEREFGFYLSRLSNF